MVTQFELEFIGTTKPELLNTSFSHPLIGSILKTVRGKSSGAYSHGRSFQWTKAVKAVALLGLKAQLLSKGNLDAAIIEGGVGSLAASLDYAIDKQPMWLLDMFGVDTSGRAVARRLFLKSNPGRKRPGPTAISLNTHFLSFANIRVVQDQKELTEPGEILELIQKIEEQDAPLNLDLEEMIDLKAVA